MLGMLDAWDVKDEVLSGECQAALPEMDVTKEPLSRSHLLLSQQYLLTMCTMSSGVIRQCTSFLDRLRAPLTPNPSRTSSPMHRNSTAFEADLMIARERDTKYGTNMRKQSYKDAHDWCDREQLRQSSKSILCLVALRISGCTLNW